MSFANFLQGVSPFGPIFGKELRTTARRKRTYTLRVLYLAILLLALFITFTTTNAMSRYSGGVAMQNQQQSLLGQYFFTCFGIISVWMLGALGPILTATAISSERLHKTLNVLLMTPITAWQIVAGKLFSRLFVALTLLALGLPVLALVRLLGGVELGQMVAVTALATVAVLSSAAIGLFFSTLLNRAYVVILLSYAVMLFLYAFVPFVYAILSDGHSRGGPPQLLLATHPYALAVAVADARLFASFGGNASLMWCIGLHLGLTALLLIWSALVLRRHARKAGEVATNVSQPAPEYAAAQPPPLPPQMSVAPPPLPAAGMHAAGAPAANLHAGAMPPPIVLPYQPARLQGTRRTRVVADNPVLWREIRRPLMARKWQKIAASIICVGLILFVYWALYQDRDLQHPRSQGAWACIFNFIFGGLALIISATAVTQERESDTWTLLLATPISGATIVWGKAVGVLRRMLWPLVLIACHFLLFAVTGVITFAAAFTAVWVILTFNTLWIATGVYFSLYFRKTTMAVVMNLLVALAASLVVFGVLGLFIAIFEEYRYDFDYRHSPALDAGIIIVFILTTVLLCISLFMAFWRSRGALGLVMVATLFWLPALVVFAAKMDWISRRDMYQQVGWYVPYYFLAQIGSSAYHELSLPSGSATEEEFLLVAIVVGIIYLLAATFVLTMTAAKFSPLVGRAPQLQKLGRGDLPPSAQ
jgi:ABC-type transport system involved in multi-copper enzyme maturation permease subunit